MKNILLITSLLLSVIVFAQTVPYNVNKKKFPLGDEFQKLMPIALGQWQRYAFHDYIPGQETGHVYYKNDKREIYVEFGKATSQASMNIIWTKLYNEETTNKENFIKNKNLTSTTNKYLLVHTTKTFFYGWSRNLYYFSIKTKTKTDADEFMKLFPY